MGTAFAFLVEDAGFSGPERTLHGVAFHGEGLDIEVWCPDGHEPAVYTMVFLIGPGGVHGKWAPLDDLYVAAGCGPAQDVPESAPTRRATLKRVHQHAAGLRRLLPKLLAPGGEELIARRGR
ncbi:hypothetical protein [Actinacidiphila guanduensis]|uniref:hypothetical protein n=1 Tax=Actinacidiphila guanduensis TaxID=310781 RepID=UPI001FEA4610|nr:hypothetical protein [Actinacidiphila guanduensis]